MSAVLQALATPRRRAILRLVWDRELSHGEICGAFRDVTKGAISQHLRVLAGVGLVDSRWQGNYRYFKARKGDLGPLRAWLERMWGESLDKLAEAAEIEAARRGPRSRRRRPTNPGTQRKDKNR
jgi:DNA-binding transcriptional ArsR family regulator